MKEIILFMIYFDIYLFNFDKVICILIFFMNCVRFKVKIINKKN